MPAYPIAGPSNEGSVPKILTLFDFSAEALGQLRTWLEQNPPAIPVTQIIGFSQFTVQVATTITASQSTTSATLTDLATPGPTLDGLSAGSYLVLWGCDAESSSTSSNAGMAITIGPSFSSTIAAGAIANGASPYSVMRFAAVTLSGSQSSLHAKYQSSDGVATASFANRGLIAIKYANS